MLTPPSQRTAPTCGAHPVTRRRKTASERASLPAAGLRHWDRGAERHSVSLRPQTPARASRHCPPGPQLSAPPARWDLSSQVTSQDHPLGASLPQWLADTGQDRKDQPRVPPQDSSAGSAQLPSSLCRPHRRPASPLPSLPPGAGGSPEGSVWHRHAVDRTCPETHTRRQPRRTHIQTGADTSAGAAFTGPRGGGHGTEAVPGWPARQD